MPNIFKMKKIINKFVNIFFAILQIFHKIGFTRKKTNFSYSLHLPPELIDELLKFLSYKKCLKLSTLTRSYQLRSLAKYRAEKKPKEANGPVGLIRRFLAWFRINVPQIPQAANDHQQQMQQLANAYQQQMQQLANAHQQQMQQLANAHQQQMQQLANDLANAHRQQMQQIIFFFVFVMQQLANAHRQKIAQQQIRHRQTIAIICALRPFDGALPNLPAFCRICRNQFGPCICGIRRRSFPR